MTGNGASWPGPAKHTVAVIESAPGDMPELVCPHCGHQEEFPWGSHLRKGFVQKRYQEARARFEAHDCEAGPTRR